MVLAKLGIKQAAAAPAAPAPAAPAAPGAAAPAPPAGGAAAPAPAPPPNSIGGPTVMPSGPSVNSSFTMQLPQAGGPVDPGTGQPLMTQEQAALMAESQGEQKKKQSDPDMPTVKQPGSFMIGLSERLGKVKSATSPMFLGDLDAKSPTGRTAQPTTPAIPGALQPGDKFYGLYNFARKGLLAPMLRTGQVPGGHMTDRTSPFSGSYYQAASDIQQRFPSENPIKQLLTNFIGPAVGHLTGGGGGGTSPVGDTASQAWQNWMNRP